MKFVLISEVDILIDNIENIFDTEGFTVSIKTLNKLNISTMFLREENEFARGCYSKLGEVLERLDFLNKALESIKSFRTCPGPIDGS